MNLFAAVPNNGMTPPAIDPVATLVFFLIVFLVVGVVFLFIHLVMGSVIRPRVPDAEKLTIYECGEPTVGSAWVQFDLRYYVVALLFVVFDVEVAFFFPWATVFGKANQLADPSLPAEKRLVLSKQLQPTGVAHEVKRGMGLNKIGEKAGSKNREYEVLPIKSEAAAGWAFFAFWDIAVFFGVLMVGFAYLWRRGDIDWIRVVTHRGGEHPVGQEKTEEPKAVA